MTTLAAAGTAAPDDAAIARFRADGYLVVERLLDGGRLARIAAEADAVIADRRVDPRDLFRQGYLAQWGVFSDHVWGLESRGAALAALQADAAPRAIAAALAGRAVAPIGLSMQVMAGACGCRQPWHQDHTPGDPTLWWINAVYYLDDMGDDNGSLLVLPGTQMRALTRRMPDYGPLPGSVRIRCPAGSAVFFTNGLLHAVDENRAAATRRALKVNYVPIGLDFNRRHEQRYARGVRRGDGPVAAVERADGSHWFAS